jgi:flagellar secretion chaperone FliS
VKETGIRPETNMTSSELAYRQTAVEGASGFGLLIALYDTLAGNLRRAVEAQRCNDIQKRSKEVNHAALVLSYLENWIDREDGGELSQKLIAFYANLRRVLLEAQLRQAPELLEQQMALVVKIRGTWQDLELRASTTLEIPPAYQAQGYPGASGSQEHHSVSNWSA